MSIRKRMLGIAAALVLGAGIASPASAANTVDVSIAVVNNGAGVISFSLNGGGNVAFNTLNLNADTDPTDGVTDAGTVEFEILITGDDKLYRDGGAVNLKLGTGTNASAHLNLTSGDPTFTGANQVDFQIPGRYLSISGLNNPQQSKWTNPGGTHGDPIWAGSVAHTPNGTHGRVPRVAGSATTGQAIYKVGDIGGTFGGDGTNSACNVTTGTAVQAWIGSCGEPAFKENSVTKQIAYIYPGSGFVAATHKIQLRLLVPDGVYPGTYTGVLTLETSFS